MGMLQHKERHGRLGFYGYDLQDQCGAANSLSYRSDEGLPFELRGPNYPNYAMKDGKVVVIGDPKNIVDHLTDSESEIMFGGGAEE